MHLQLPVGRASTLDPPYNFDQGTGSNLSEYQ